MWPSSCWIYLILGVLYLAPVQRVMACSCMLEHPQNHFCNSDFVAVVRVKKILPVNRYEIAYKVKINKVFKSSPKADIALKPNLLWTASIGSACGVTNFHVGETYVITGRVISGKPRISICQLIMRWADVTSRQRKAFRLFYQRGCVCEISYTPWWRKGEALKSAGGKRCLWESTPGPWDCQQNFGVCMMAPGGCSWIPSIPYKYCIKEHQREREQKRAMEP